MSTLENQKYFYMLTFKRRSGQFWPCLCVDMEAETAIFGQIHIRELFALYTVLGVGCESVNIMYTFYRLKINF
jgi:hypothetical protein